MLWVVRLGLAWQPLGCVCLSIGCLRNAGCQDPGSCVTLLPVQVYCILIALGLLFVSFFDHLAACCGALRRKS